MELLTLVMTRRMLLGITERAEGVGGPPVMPLP